MRSSPLQIPYAGEINSHELNAWADKVLADVEEALKIQEEAREQASLITLLQSYEDLFLSKQQEETAKEFRLLRREIQAMELRSGKVNLDLSVMNLNVEEGTPMAIYGLVLPKLHTVVDRLPEDVAVEITVAPQADEDTIVDTKVSSAVDHRYDTVWLRTVTVPVDNPMTEAEAQLEITLPTQVPTARLNLIGLLPYPAWGLEVVEISALNEQGIWQTIHTGPTMGPLLTTFIPLYTSRIKVHLRQRYPLLFGDKKVFVLGLRDLTALSVSFGDTIRLKTTAVLPQSGLWVTGISLVPSDPNIRVNVKVNNSDILPAFIEEDRCEMEVALEGKSLPPLRGLTLHLARQT